MEGEKESKRRQDKGGRGRGGKNNTEKVNLITEARYGSDAELTLGQ